MPLIGKGVLAVWNDVDPAAEAEFNAWYLAEHLPERLAVPGFRRARRWWNPGGSPRYFTFYEVDGPEVLASAPYRERLDNPTPRTRAIMPAFRGMSRTVCRVAASVGDAMGGVAAVVRLSPGPGEAEALTARLPALLEEPGIVAAHLWQGDEGASRVDAAETRLRAGADSVIDWALVVEATRPDELAAATAFGGPLEGYALLCCRTA
jgi:hypothetical protein